MSHDLLDPPPLSASGFAEIERRVAGLLGAANDVVLVQAEAVLALEAVARGVGRPGLVCLNIVTGPYGALFGSWLAAAGSEVLELVLPSDRAAEPEDVVEALSRRPDIGVVVVVHAEAATGVLNPLDEIATVVRDHGAALIVDAVATAGAHPLPMNVADFCVIGPQKGLAGPAGVSIASVSPRGWDLLRESPTPWRSSSLSLLDWKERWIESGRTAVPGTPAVLEMLALDAACARVAREGLDAAIARHLRCRHACRDAVRALGLDVWVAADDRASAVATTVRLPAGCDPSALLAFARDAFGVALVAGAGDLHDLLVRIDHMGSGATTGHVVAAVTALGEAVRREGVPVDVGAAVEAAARVGATALVG